MKRVYVGGGYVTYTTHVQFQSKVEFRVLENKLI